MFAKKELYESIAVAIVTATVCGIIARVVVPEIFDSSEVWSVGIVIWAIALLAAWIYGKSRFN